MEMLERSTGAYFVRIFLSCIVYKGASLAFLALLFGTRCSLHNLQKLRGPVRATWSCFTVPPVTTSTADLLFVILLLVVFLLFVYVYLFFLPWPQLLGHSEDRGVLLEEAGCDLGLVRSCSSTATGCTRLVKVRQLFQRKFYQTRYMSLGQGAGPSCIRDCRVC